MNQCPDSPPNLRPELERTLAAGPLVFGLPSLLAYLRALPTKPLRPDRTWYEITPSGLVIRL